MNSLPRSVEAFLAEPHLATLTTIRPDGSPHVVPVRFSWDGAASLARVMTVASSRKARTLAADLITDGGYRKRPLTALWFRDLHTPGRRRTILTCAEVMLEFGEHPLDPVLHLHERQSHPIDSGAASVGPAPSPRLPQHVTSVDTVIQVMETPLRRLLGRSP